MATYGGYSGPIKKTLGDLTQVTSSGANVSVTITNPLETDTRQSKKYITCIVTTTGNVRIGIGEAATATSFLLTSSDELVCAVRSDDPIGTWGDGGTPTVTIRRIIT